MNRLLLSHCCQVCVLVLPIVFPAAASAEPLAKAKKGDWPMWGGTPDRNMVSGETGIATEWDLKPGKNIKWVAKLGSQSYGNPVIHKGKIFVGTNNGALFRPDIKGDKGILLAFEEKTGRLLWQATHDKLPTGRVNDWPEQGICSAPAAEGNRIWYVSNRCELVCADVEGFLDGENNGPFKDEQYKEKEDADFIWVLDMIEDLGVFPHNLATSSPLLVGDTLFLMTSNGVDEGHLNLPAPDAPAFIGVDKNSGKVLWTRSDPGEKTLHGQWSSPAYGVVNGKPQVFFAGGDGWCYALDPKNGELIWKYDLNPKDSKYVLGGRGTKSYIIGTPVFHDNRVYLAVGQDPEHGEGPGHLHAIDATKTGDVTGTAQIWHRGNADYNRTLSTVAVADGLVYAADLSGYLYCLDEKDGTLYWKHDVLAAVWGSPYVVDGKVFLGDEEGDVVVMKHGKEMKVLATNVLDNAVYSTPVAANGVLYIATRNKLYAIEEKKSSDK